MQHVPPPNCTPMDTSTTLLGNTMTMASGISFGSALQNFLLKWLVLTSLHPAPHGHAIDFHLHSVSTDGHFTLDWTSGLQLDMFLELLWLCSAFGSEWASQAHLLNAPQLLRSSPLNSEGNLTLAKMSSVSSVLNGKQRETNGEWT